ncbi:hypothetical protein BGZ61DRAFT_485448 [Ilyonectria robusta]|uniref:uncharacterized protein n=1 Tax=Ilyonectria robusta TaxID=1079257 RepID=UPI001E8D7A4B|nr:uncharacterized protein BGZ61DRAFT_485448 [Ilyonectria robusta]KAH8661323.1 hypothetical protein BGZ61DRAFT_485448 [Ilyonectria robusta]
MRQAKVFAEQESDSKIELSNVKQALELDGEWGRKGWDANWTRLAFCGPLTRPASRLCKISKRQVKIAATVRGYGVLLHCRRQSRHVKARQPIEVDGDHAHDHAGTRPALSLMDGIWTRRLLPLSAQRGSASVQGSTLPSRARMHHAHKTRTWPDRIPRHAHSHMRARPNKRWASSGGCKCDIGHLSCLPVI